MEMLECDFRFKIADLKIQDQESELENQNLAGFNTC